MEEANSGARPLGATTRHVVKRIHVGRIRCDARALGRTAAFILSMAPGPISWPVRLVTGTPDHERVLIPAAAPFDLDVYRPRSPGPHPGILVSLGVLPVGVADPRVAMVGEAFSRAGFVTLLFWSPSMRELRIDRDDIPRLVSAYRALLARPDVDPTRSGLFGVCVGGAFALIAAAQPEIRDRVAFVAAHAPYSSLRTLALEIAGESRSLGATREPWAVDPLTWKAYVRCLTGWLDDRDAAALRALFEDRIAWNATKTRIVRSPVRGRPDPATLSADGRAVLRLLEADADDAEPALDALPLRVSSLLAWMSPMTWVAQIAAPVLVLLHDRNDRVIPVAESRNFWAAIDGRRGATYTELGFNHLRVPRTWSFVRVVREMARAFGAWYPVFRASTR
jgi:hypothetical protein